MVNQLRWWNYEMVKLPQWIYGKLSKRNGILFFASTTLFPTFDKRKNWFRGSFSSSISDSFLPFLLSWYLCSSSYPSTNPPLFQQISMKLNPSIFLLIYPSFYPYSLLLRIPLSRYLPTTLHLHLHPFLPLPHKILPPLHIHPHLCPL